MLDFPNFLVVGLCKLVNLCLQLFVSAIFGVIFVTQVAELLLEERDLFFLGLKKLGTEVLDDLFELTLSERITTSLTTILQSILEVLYLLV